MLTHANREYKSLQVTQIGYMLALLSLVYSIVGVPAGYLGDRIGYVRVLIPGVLCSGLCLLVLGARSADVSQFRTVVSNYPVF
jgi:MFS family permease